MNNNKEPSNEDSTFDDISKDAEKVIFNLLTCSKNSTIRVENVQRQLGNKDCAVFAVATATAILHVILEKK